MRAQMAQMTQVVRAFQTNVQADRRMRADTAFLRNCVLLPRTIEDMGPLKKKASEKLQLQQAI